MKLRKRIVLLLAATLFTALTSQAQLSISTGSTVGENFTIGTSPSATLPAHWRIDKQNSVRTLGAYFSGSTTTERRGGNNMGITSQEGIYNFGAGDANQATERAVGWLSATGATESGNLYTYLKNTGTDSIYSFSISYDVEKYRKGSNSAGFTVQLYYSEDGVNWTDAGTDFKTSFPGGGYDNSGYNPAPGVTVNVTNKTLIHQLHTGDTLFLAWNYSVTSGSITSFAQALGVDNFVITANAFPPAYDMAVTEWISPTSNCNLANNELINVKVKNFGVDTVTSFTITYSINNGVNYISPEVFNDTVLPGEEITYAFTTAANFSASGTYNCIVAVHMNTDPNHVNDTLHATLISVPIVTNFPYFENFEGFNGWTTMGTLWQHGVPSQSGISSAKSGTKVWMTGLSSNYTNNVQEYLYSPCYDFSSLPSPIFSAWLNLNIPDVGNDAMILEYTLDNGTTWQKVQGNTGFYNYSGSTGSLPSPKWSGNSNGWAFYETPLTGLGNQSSVRFRLHFASNATINGEGVAVDDIMIRNPFGTDLAVTGWVSPTTSCGLSDTVQISVLVANVGANTITQFPIAYSLNNGTTYIPNETYNGSLAPGDTITYTFTTVADLSQPDNYYIVASVNLLTDQNNLNDKLYQAVTSLPYVTTFPYLQDNESTFTGWTSGSISGLNQWELGAPNQTALNDAYSGSKVWMTRLSYNYNNSVVSTLMSPCFDLTNLTDPFFSAMLNIRTETGYDAMILESSTDGGQSWTKVTGDAGFYNSTSNLGSVTPPKWSGNNAGWMKYETSLASFAGQSNVRFRFVFNSNNNNNEEGIAVDDMIVRDKYDNDLTIVEWVGPTGGCGMTNQEVVTLKIANLGKLSQSNFSVGFALNGGTFTFETCSLTVAPGDTISYTFNAHADFSIPMDYGCMAIVNLVTDQNTMNDAFYTSVTCIPYITTYPYFQNFELGRAGWSSDALSGNNQWDFGTCNQTVINFPKSGIAAWMTGLDADYDNNSDCYLLSPCMNFSTLTNPQISVWVNMKINDEGNDAMILEKSIDGGNTWVKVTGGALYNYADTVGALPPPKWSGSTSGWTEFKAPLTGMAGQTNVKLRFRFQSDGNNVDEGVAVDDIMIHDPFANDVAILEWMSPISECHMTNNEIVTIKIANLGTVPQTNFSLVYSTDGGMNFTPAQYYSTVLNPGDTMMFVFNTHADFSVANVYNCIAWVNLQNDQNTNNDIVYAKVYSVPTFNTFPYTDDYEAFYSGWTSKSITGVDQWGHGTPDQLTLSYPHSGASAWMTKLSSKYNNNAHAVLMSPCLNMQALTNPQISIWINMKAEPGYDAMILEKSTNGGGSWTKLDGDPNFYNNTSANGPINNPPKWSGNNNGWTNYVTTASSLVSQPDVRLRFRFASDLTGNDEGFAVDDFMIYQPINNDLGVTAVLKPIDDVCGSFSDSIFIEVKNFGTTAQSQIPIKVDVLYPSTFMAVKYDTLNTTLNPGQSAVFFIDTVNTTESGTYFVFASTQLASDTINSFNNMTTSSFDVKLPLDIPYVEDFEGANIEWTGNITIDQQHGASSKVMFASLSSGTNNLEANSTKIGPITNLSRVKFDYRLVNTAGTPYTMQNGDAVQIFATNDCFSNSYMLFEINNGNHTPSANMHSLEFDLSAFSGYTVFLSFKYITGGQSYFVDVDNFIVANAPVVELGNDTTLCTGTVLLDAATAPQNSLFYWRELSLPDTISTASTLLVTETGYYHVTVDNGYGMTVSDSIQIEINPLPVFELGPDVHVCSGTPVTITASGGVTYHWNNGQTSAEITVNPTTVTNYSVTVTDNNGCFATDDINIVTMALPNVNLGPNQTICHDAQITLNAGSNFSSYSWSTGASTQYITVDATVVGIGTFPYSVTVTNANDCQGSGNIVITVQSCVNSKNPENSVTAFDIYPNPTDGTFNLVATGSVKDELQIYIYNAQAKLMKNLSADKIYHNYTRKIDLSHFPKGVYYMKLINGNEVLLKKIIIQ